MALPSRFQDLERLAPEDFDSYSNQDLVNILRNFRVNPPLYLQSNREYLIGSIF